MKGGTRPEAGHQVIGLVCARKGKKEKIVCACAKLHKGRHSQMQWKGVMGGTGWGSDVLRFKECIPGPPVSVFGDVPELSVSSETPRLGRVHPLEGVGCVW